MTNPTIMMPTDRVISIQLMKKEIENAWKIRSITLLYLRLEFVNVVCQTQKGVIAKLYLVSKMVLWA